MFLVMKTGCKPHEVFAERVQLAEQSEPQFPLSLRPPLCWWGGPILVGSTPYPHQPKFSLLQQKQPGIFKNISEELRF